MMSKFFEKLLIVGNYYICNPFEKVLNTFLWLLVPSSKIVVVNVYLRHFLFYLYKENLGDDLNYYLVKKLTGKFVVNYFYSYLNLLQPVNFMCIGSIVRRSNKNSIIWGSGAIEDSLDDMKEKPNKVVAVRGPLTRALLLKNGINCPPVYGDPAILLPYIYPCKKEKKYRLGIIPHFLDYDNDNIKKIQESNQDGVVIIKMKNYKSFKDVINTINECEFIASSSLHGLILSDAYCVPNVWIKLSDRIIGGNFKFLDYYKGCEKNEIDNPIDYCGKELNVNDLLSYKSQYTKPKYNIRDLIISCPFANNKVIDNILKKIEAQNG